MGLDMYLYRMRRHRGATADDVDVVESYLDWKRSKAEGSQYANCTFEEWCGFEKEPSRDNVLFYQQFYKATYSDWDKEHKHPWWRIKEEVGYWRKANHIHNWFVENIQDGVDDCEYHREITEEDLRELLDVCKAIFNSSEMVEGLICNGYKYEDGKRVPIMEDGRVLKNPSIAKELLPTSSGFFFGGTDYDEYYMQDIIKTMQIIERVLETTNFDTEMIYYRSSW